MSTKLKIYTTKDMEKVDKIIFKNLQKIVKKERLADVGAQTLLREDLAISSLDMISLFVSITGELKLEITEFADTDVFQVATVGDLKKMLTDRIISKAGV